MRAAVFIRPGSPLEIQDVPDPTPGPGDVVLRIDHCGICATDIHFTEPHAHTVPSGFVVGHERGAEVVAVGPGVENLKVGDSVVPHPMRGCGKCGPCLSGSPYYCKQAQICMGGFAQYMLAPAFTCAKMPKSLSLADAALVEPLAVGLLSIQINPFPVGSNIVVLGSGTVGLASIFWARRAGARRIVAVAPSRKKERFARMMGADAFLTLGDDIVGELREVLEGDDPDVVIECAGVPGAIEKSVELVKTGGSVTVMGVCFQHDTWVPAGPLLKEVKLQFAVATNLSQFLRAADFLSAGHVEPIQMVTNVISLQQLPAMFEKLRGRNDECKVLLNPWL